MALGMTTETPARWDVAEAVDRNAEQSIAQLQRLLRLPSVAVRNEGLAECAQQIVAEIAALGLEARLISTPICPMVFGQSVQRADRPTLLLTSHYDVQPPEPLAEWSQPPYAAHRDGERIIARGATDAKGNLVAIIAALEAIRSVSGDYPLNIKLLFDGAEEQGSPQLDQFFAEHHHLLTADAVVTFDAGFTPTGHPFIWLGSSGMLNVELIATGGDKDLHSSRARLAYHPGWSLIQTLATIQAADGRISIDGFYDHVRVPTSAERAVLSVYPWDDDAYRRELGVQAFPHGLTGVAALEQLLFTPSCTITGLASGYAGAGSKEVLPNRAVAKLEFRLVANQTADETYSKLQAHLRRAGNDRIELRRLASTDPTQSPLDSTIATALTTAARTVYQKPVATKPRHESSGRQAIWLAQQLGVPGAISGIGPPNWRGHAPDEFILTPYFINGIKYIAATIQEFAALAARDPGSFTDSPNHIEGES